MFSCKACSTSPITCRVQYHTSRILWRIPTLICACQRRTRILRHAIVQRSLRHRDRSRLSRKYVSRTLLRGATNPRARLVRLFRNWCRSRRVSSATAVSVLRVFQEYGGRSMVMKGSMDQARSSFLAMVWTRCIGQGEFGVLDCQDSSLRTQRSLDT